jgi:RNA polymerase sigma factor (sigma-70 family)
MMQETEQSHDLVNVFLVHRKQLCQTAARILGSQDRAEDVVQDAYFKIANVKTVFMIKKPVAYVFRIVRNLAIDHYRHAAFESGVFVVHDTDQQEEQSLLGVPEKECIGRQELLLIVKALEQLPKRTRRAFELYRIEGSTQREIAEILNVSPTLVNFMIRDALKQCQSALR